MIIIPPPVPAMTHPLSKHWDQPYASAMLFEAEDDGLEPVRVRMRRATWEALCAYDTPIPSGVYEGKMWRCSPWDGSGHYLRWYGTSRNGNPDQCSINTLPAIICDCVDRGDGRVCYYGISRDDFISKIFPICEPNTDAILWAITDKAATCIVCMARRSEGA